jgi:nucleoside-diphosphate-sugar epimerase
LSECIKYNIHKFIFASSCSVYGQTNKICNEESKLNPVSLYAKCKIASEKSILSHKSKTFCPVILRLSTVYGDSPRKRFDLVVNRFVIMTIKKIQIKLFGASSWRPFISVSDVARAFDKILHTKNEVIKNQIFNVGGKNENYKILDIVKIISKFHKIDYSFTETVDDKRNYRVSFSKIQNLVNFKLKNKLPDVIKLLLKKYKKQKININNINYYNEKKIFSILNK